VPQPTQISSDEAQATVPGRSTRRALTLQLARFGVTGALVFAVYTGGTLLLSGPLGVPIAIAIAIAYLVGVTLHFLLQRHFVFMDRDAFALPLKSQLTRYVVAGVCQYTITVVAVKTLAPAIGVSQQLVFLAVVVAISLVSFAVLRGAIFHAPSRPAPEQRPGT
jgi:putative flippase GtrA